MTVPPFSNLESFLPPRENSCSRIGLLGGSFDPPHLSHQLLALSVLALEPLDTLWILPCKNHPFNKPLTAFHHRVTMCQLAFRRLNQQIQVIEIEHHLHPPSFTINTLEILHHFCPHSQFSLIIGTDVFQNFHHWHRPNDIIQLSQLIIVPRQGYPLLPPPMKLPYRLHQGYSLPALSSTEIKQGFYSCEKSILDTQVKRYILEEGLYTAKSSFPLGEI